MKGGQSEYMKKEREHTGREKRSWKKMAVRTRMERLYNG